MYFFIDNQRLFRIISYVDKRKIMIALKVKTTPKNNDKKLFPETGTRNFLGKKSPLVGR